MSRLRSRVKESHISKDKNDLVSSALLPLQDYLEPLLLFTHLMESGGAEKLVAQGHSPEVVASFSCTPEDIFIGGPQSRLRGSSHTPVPDAFIPFTLLCRSMLSVPE